MTTPETLRRESWRSMLCGFGFAVAIGLLLGVGLDLALAPASHAAPLPPGITFVVNSTVDPGDGICDATCTLRDAINAANASAGADTISFDIPGAGVHTIQPISALPVITDPVTIDGSTQPGAIPVPPICPFTQTQMVELDGTHAGAGAAGLAITAGNSTVHGLIIDNFDGDGILLDTNGGNAVEGNFIGFKGTGSALEIKGNHGHGIAIVNGSSGNRIGGTASDARNAIGFNLGAGIAIVAGTSNEIRSNYIFNNGELGIDLGADGVTPNDDPGDLDVGPNTMQNFPELIGAMTVVTAGLGPELQGVTIISGTLHSTPTTTFTLEFFSNTVCNPGARLFGALSTGDPAAPYGEGEGVIIGLLAVTTDDNGDASFAETFVGDYGGYPVPTGRYFTATATDPDGNTSEFSPCKGVLEVDYFRYSAASVVISVTIPIPGVTFTRTVDLAGPTKVEVDLGALDPKQVGDGLESVPTEMVQLELSGEIPGPVGIGMIPVTITLAMTPTTGMVTENENIRPGRLDLPPFAAGTGLRADSYFDVYAVIEVAVPGLPRRILNIPTDDRGTLMANLPTRMQTEITRKPPDVGTRYLKVGDVLYVLTNGVVVSKIRHVPNPDTIVAVTLVSFTATPYQDRVVLEWETASEFETDHFNIWRSETANGQYVQLNAAPIPAQGGPTFGASYEYTDGQVAPGATYYYQLEDVDIYGGSHMHGPVSATVPIPTAVRMINLSTSASEASIMLALVILAMLVAVALVVFRRQVRSG